MTCKDCNNAPNSCDAMFIEIDSRWQLRKTSTFACSCGIADGGIHHYGCDKEVCPICSGQLISCNCKKSVVGTLTKGR
jgi:hypothetical protein